VFLYFINALTHLTAIGIYVLHLVLVHAIKILILPLPLVSKDITRSFNTRNEY
jgi:hypothetical protein